MRIRRSFERPEGKKSAKLVVVASEGKETERIYFTAVREYMCAGNVHMEILDRDSTDSAPEVVYDQLKGFMETYSLDDDDELWMVIDRDRWSAATLAKVARLCAQNRFMRFAMSNPCFELWLLLHFEDVETLSESEWKALAENKRVSRRGDPWLKNRIRMRLGSYHESSYDASRLMPYVAIARDRAARLDDRPDDRWPQGPGSRVYRLIDSITNRQI